MKLGMKSAFIMAEINLRLLAKREVSLTYLNLKVLNRQKNKIVGTNNLKEFHLESDFDSLRSFNPQFNLSCKHELYLKCRSGLKLSSDSR